MVQVSQFSPELDTAKTTRPKSNGRWRVILYADNRHQFDDVVFWLEGATACETDFAYQISHVCEDQGRAVCFQGPKEECRKIADRLRSKGLQVEVDDF